MGLGGRCRPGAHRLCRLRRVQRRLLPDPQPGQAGQHYDVPAELTMIAGSAPSSSALHALWVPWNWRGWLPFGTGCIGDWFCHVIDPSFWALDLGAPYLRSGGGDRLRPGEAGPHLSSGNKITLRVPGDEDKRGPVKLVWHDGNIPITKPDDFPSDEKSRAPARCSSATRA